MHVLVLALLLVSQPESLKQVPDRPKPFREKMHASPADWRDQSVYFVMTDRFCDGDPSNNRAGHHGYDPSNAMAAHGGDFRGVASRLDYIKGLGATTVWLTPVVQNYEGYHGYHACDWLAADPRLGGLDDLRLLVAEAHQRGMYVVIDVVVNHGADLRAPVDGSTKWTAERRPHEFVAKKGQKVLPRPVEFQNPDWYHDRGDVQDWDDIDKAVSQSRTGDFVGLDDLATERADVRAAMIKIWKYWIAMTDVDGFRVDTVKHVEKEFWQQWVPAIREYARSIGKRNFLIYGEFWSGEDARVAPYTKDGLFDGMVGFPMYYTMREVFREGRSPEAITRRMEAAKQYRDDALNVVFFDNHDQARFLNATDARALRGQLAFLYSGRGIPCLYYGTEQGFSGGSDPANREDMFEKFNPKHELYEYVAKLGKIRRESEALRRGAFVARWAEPGGRGLYAFSRVTEGEEVLVAFNTAGEARSARSVKVERGAGSAFVDAIDGRDAVRIGDGNVDLALPAYGVRIYRRR